MLLVPGGSIAVERRRINRQTRDQRVDAARRARRGVPAPEDLIYEVKPVKAREVSLDEIPAVCQ